MSNDKSQSTVKRTIFERKARSVGYELRVIGGADVGRSVMVTEASCIFVGRNDTCGLFLTDPSVAARQCSLQLDRGQLHMRDLASSSVEHTTRVNGVEAKEAFLGGGEVLRAGETVIFVRRVEDVDASAPRSTSFGRMRGESPAMRALFPAIQAASEARADVLIEGPRGSGKRLLAHELHDAHDALRPFVSYEAREDVDEDELFAPGGLFEQASGGTLYIAEVRALPVATQRKLAKLLPEMYALPESARVRIVAATRGPALGELAAELSTYFTDSAGAYLVLPSLREREGDAIDLAHHFWRELGGEGVLPDQFAARYVDHTWPGNVRELRIAVQNELLHGGQERSDEDVEARLSRVADDILGRVIAADMPMVEARHKLLAEFEKRYVVRAMERAGAHVGRAARASGIAVRYFQVLRARASV
jgi:DNA-binding NtrC family response regulator